MNIFFLDRNPVLAARYHCDKHVVKMILETAQILSTAHRILDPDEDHSELYKKTHSNHPASVWARGSVDQYMWTWCLLANLCFEYRRRYGKKHKVQRSGLLTHLARPPMTLHGEPTWVDPPQCMPDEYKGDCAVKAYRDYYVGEKARFAKWKVSGAPWWWSK